MRRTQERQLGEPAPPGRSQDPRAGTRSCSTASPPGSWLQSGPVSSKYSLLPSPQQEVLNAIVWVMPWTRLQVTVKPTQELAFLPLFSHIRIHHNLPFFFTLQSSYKTWLNRYKTHTFWISARERIANASPVRNYYWYNWSQVSTPKIINSSSK